MTAVLGLNLQRTAMFPYSDVVAFLRDRHQLTKKEAQVLAEIIVSGPNKETVALKLGIAASTAYLHFKRIYEKLQVEGMSQLFHLVIQTHQKLQHENATRISAGEVISDKSHEP